MFRFFVVLLILCGAAIPLHAELTYQGGFNPDISLEQYFEEEHPKYERSIIYVFYNSETCYNCPQTIKLIKDVYDKYYQDKYQLEVIDYFSDETYNYQANYDLKNPLEVVLQRAEYGDAEGYRKIENLENMTSDVVSFEENLRYQINSFLG